MSRWTSVVEDNLPHIGRDVLIHAVGNDKDADYFIVLGTLDVNGWKYAIPFESTLLRIEAKDYEVTHWMYVAEAPENEII